MGKLRDVKIGAQIILQTMLYAEQLVLYYIVTFFDSMQTVLLIVISLVVLCNVNFSSNKGTWMFPYRQARYNHL
jgi:hypothetical protein